MMGALTTRYSPRSLVFSDVRMLQTFEENQTTSETTPAVRASDTLSLSRVINLLLNYL